jgi:hypothetical protein
MSVFYRVALTWANNIAVEIVESVNEPLQDLMETLGATIDFAASKESGRLAIKEGVHPPLDDR